MTESLTHIAAVFPTAAAADKAKAGLVSAGVPADCVLVLYRGAADTQTRQGLWAKLKARRLPDRHAHPYAEAVTRGHPLLVADVNAAHLDAALAAVAAEGPIDIESHDKQWQAEGWDGTFDGDADWQQSSDRGPAGSDGIVGGDLIAGDYGAVGAPLGAHVDTNILRGSIRLFRKP